MSNPVTKQRKKRVCRWCAVPLPGTNRKFCGPECKESAMEAKARNPSPEEIRAICQQIREEGGERWELSRSCYPSHPVEAPVVRVAAVDVRHSV